MNKESQEKTPFDHLTATINDYTLAGAYRLGFKHARSKLPEGEPPLSDEENPYMKSPAWKSEVEAFNRGKQAQRDSNIKWMRGE